MFHTFTRVCLRNSPAEPQAELGHSAAWVLRCVGVSPGGRDLPPAQGAAEAGHRVEVDGVEDVVKVHAGLEAHPLAERETLEGIGKITCM